MISVNVAWLALTRKTEMFGELVFCVAWCCQPYRMGHGQKSNLKWIWWWSLPARWASGFPGEHQQNHQCLWSHIVVIMLLMYSVLHCLYSVRNKITTTDMMIVIFKYPAGRQWVHPGSVRWRMEKEQTLAWSSSSPTTGLDASTANTVMTILYRWATQITDPWINVH